MSPLSDNPMSVEGNMVVNNVFPVVKSYRSGVSVEYAHDPRRQWFVLRVSYGREKKAHDILVEDGVYVYLAMHYVDKTIQGRRKRLLVPLIPNLIFAYLTENEAENYLKFTPELSFLSYYYDHFHQNSRNANPPLIIPQKEMQNFVLATISCSEHLLLVNPSNCHYKSGDLVRVVDGPFQGVEGKVARVAGQQRVVVSLSSIGLISTAYIPSAFIRKVEENE